MKTKRRYCSNCKYKLATTRLVCDDMVAYTCDECFDKRPEGWDIKREGGDTDEEA